MNELNLCKTTFVSLFWVRKLRLKKVKAVARATWVTAGQVPSFSATGCPGWVTSSSPTALTVELFQILLENLDAFYKVPLEVDLSFQLCHSWLFLIAIFCSDLLVESVPDHCLRPLQRVSM